MDCLTSQQIDKYLEGKVAEPSMLKGMTRHLMVCDPCWLSTSERLYAAGVDSNSFMWQMKAFLGAADEHAESELQKDAYRLAAAGKHRPIPIKSWISEEAGLMLNLWRDEDGVEFLSIKVEGKSLPTNSWLVEYRRGDAVILRSNGNRVILSERSLMLESRRTLPVYPVGDPVQLVHCHLNSLTLCF